MKKFMFALLVALLLTVSCSKNSPTEPQGTYKLFVGNASNQSTYYIYINDMWIASIDRESFSEIGDFPERKDTNFHWRQMNGASNTYDTTVSTVDCDSIVWYMGIGEKMILYYE